MLFLKHRRWVKLSLAKSMHGVTWTTGLGRIMLSIVYDNINAAIKKGSGWNFLCRGREKNNKTIKKIHQNLLIYSS